MGSIYRATCPCGYDAGGVHVGVGFSAVLHSAAICRTCERVFSIRVDRVRLRCPRCRRKPEVIDVEESSASARCPKCGQETLRFEFEGLWD